jgi:hypothetical protein
VNLAERLQVCIAAYAQVHSLLALDGRGMSIPALEAQLARLVVS